MTNALILFDLMQNNIVLRTLHEIFSIKAFQGIFIYFTLV